MWSLPKLNATYGGTLANAVYGIYTENGTQAGTLTTDSSGYAKSGPLPYGSYYLQEITAPDGVVLDPNQYPFTNQRPGYRSHHEPGGRKPTSEYPDYQDGGTAYRCRSKRYGVWPSILPDLRCGSPDRRGL